MAAGTIIILFALFFLVAALYSSVGHAGASGYLAVMALMSFAPESIKPTSLVLNIVVAFIASVKFIRAGYFDKRIFLAFIVTSVPHAFLGGYLTVPSNYFKLVAGIFLIISGGFLLLREYMKSNGDEQKEMPFYAGSILGSVIGLFSGLIGVGGGIFLSPILIMKRWTTLKKASGIAALFILVNSISGLAGNLTAVKHLDGNIAYWIAAVILGGLTGSWLGTKKYNNKLIVTFLFVVLISAGIKFIFVDFMK